MTIINIICVNVYGAKSSVFMLNGGGGGDGEEGMTKIAKAWRVFYCQIFDGTACSDGYKHINDH
jgi:hypothetical protein